jgi:alanyl-tRNA synthetase
MSEKIKTAHEIRRAYVDFFIEKGHTEVPSAPLAPKGDPTLLFTSAGMVQFKDYYLQPDNLPYSTAVSVQKCLRAGDLESVGRTLRHHTFFEMLGNFSFGDYFKLEAIRWAWEFVIELLELPEDKLTVSIFTEDDEAFEIWNKEIGLPADRIFRLGKKDNFWGPVGATGVCGPCSEIYYDTGPERSCGEAACAPGCDCDRYLEFWNLVFPQFFLEESGHYRPLKKPGIDTGLGLERLATIMQGVEDNFHTDLFAPILEALEGMLPSSFEIGLEERMSLNMIADHARALTFTISEGIYPSNEGRGYLLRRLLRRALTRFYMYGIDKPFLHELVDVITGVMKEDYPELEDRRRDTSMIIRAEEENFFRTLEDGRSRFASLVSEVKGAGEKKIGGNKVFLLYDTFGFPVELTRELSAAEGLGIDEEGFEEAMEQQRQRAQEKSEFGADEQEQVSMIELSAGESSMFTGYETVTGEAELRKYRFVDRPSGSAIELILDTTPFYATSGGQVADIGWIEIGGRRLAVRDVFKRGGDTVHLVESDDPPQALEKTLAGGGRVHVQVDDERRMSIARNHTATHLLHAALRKIVGGHVTQAGSLVDEERLRFDFNHFQAVAPEALRRIEEDVNRNIRAAMPVTTEMTDYKKAVDDGVTALFDEKYGAKVRAVRISDISAELCGGTHVSSTGQIGTFLIISESSIAAGVRRIEAITGSRAVAHIQEMREQEDEIAGVLKVTRDESAGRVRALLDEVDGLKKEIRRMERGGAGGELDRIIGAAQDIDGIRITAGRLPAKDIAALRNQADIFRSRSEKGIAVLSAPIKKKLQFIVTVTDDLIDTRGITANELVRELGDIAGGGGGGKKHLAQLGTKDMESEGRVFEALPEIVRRMVKGRTK